MKIVLPIVLSVLILIPVYFFGFRSDTPNEPISNVQTPPNIVFVLADQWRAQEVGYAGNDQIITPNLNKLATESLIFENAVTTMAVCAPWRASFLTGQYPLTHGVFYNDKPLPNEAYTFAEIYKEAGYQTGYIGKWHLNGHARGADPFSARDQPVPKDRRQGFDYWKVREVTHNYNNSFYFDEEDKKHVWEGYDVFPQTDSAISYISKNKEKPFVLMLSYGPPHDPYFSAPKEYQDLYDAGTLKLRPNVPEEYQDSARRVLAGYYAHATAIDKAIGDLLEGIEKAGVADNTIFVFTSEHGDMLMSRGVVKKQRPWDEAIKVPMLIRYPGKLESRRVLDPIGTPDILPTLLGLSDIPIPKSIEGKDFSKNLLSGKDLENDATLIMLPVPFHEWQFKNGGREYRGIRTRRYTYVKDLLGPWLLYDNENDPFQLNNLVNQSEYNSLQKKLEKSLSKKLKEINDKFWPADEYMNQWNYLYDRTDSLRAENYLEINR
ncbi:sulfatase family protein [Algoriphagus machipongonensis]|uniref:N-acetylglucosamine-6-sulfatase n=1 Tax=Algoriphagus machipongonensis TaxID=388413 RepID=A3I0S5_9BACT|nr:sulfatase [Algoriphagus machipongonensis]EAZ80071.1 putative N-acetylglucosamine-6-sulfatase [Algoriphagus machipongonensis]